MKIALHDDWFWPADDTKARQIILRDAEPDIHALLQHVPGRDLILQAGGNTGVYPQLLSAYFKTVMTLECDPTNYECLIRNVKADNVLIGNGALGAEMGTCSMDHMDPTNCGAHRIQSGNDIPVVTIDSLNLDACDVIWLDIEGSEPQALMGGLKTIERFKPVISVEDKGLDAHYGFKAGECARILWPFGYREVARHGRDKIYVVV